MRRIRSTGGILLLALACATAGAFLWDSDTLRAEAAGAPGVLEVLVGRFDQFPPAYYERRLEIAEERIASDASRLESYDDAAVACDRLDRHDEAIAWMTRKRAALDALRSANAEHEYRYLANLGTFHAHRWLATGANADDTSDLQQARDLIAAAIDLNPQAHFGRERYQLLAIEWLLTCPTFDDRHSDDDPPTMLDRVAGFDQAGEFADAIDGLCGLVTLGAASESVDVHIALRKVLYDRGDSSLEYAAKLRLAELYRDGRRSLVHNMPPVLDQLEEDGPYVGLSREGNADGTDEISAWYNSARKEAHMWRQARNEYVLREVAAGKHPDTDDQFWAGWIEPHPMPKPPNGVLGMTGNSVLIFGGLGACGLVTAIPFVVVILFLRRRSHAKATAAA